MAAAQSGENVNFSSIARECCLPIKTVQSYYEILEDTLVGMRLEPWRKSLRKRLVGHPKFYFFDLGVTNAINRRLSAGLEPVLRGRLFYWRTNSGAETDLIIEKHGRIKAAVEMKSSAMIGGSDLSGLRAFGSDHPGTPLFVVCTAEHPHMRDGVQILPWQEFLSGLTKWL